MVILNDIDTFSNFFASAGHIVMHLMEGKREIKIYFVKSFYKPTMLEAAMAELRRVKADRTRISG